MIHSFGGHSKTVTSLSIHPKQRTLFISASNDNTIRIWCLDVLLFNFILIEIHRTLLLRAPSWHKQHKIDDREHLRLILQWCHKNRKVAPPGPLFHKFTFRYCVSLNIKFIYQNSRIGKCFANEERREAGETDAVYTLFKDNSAMLQSSAMDTLGRSISTIYPPPTAKEVIQICFNTTLKRMFLLLASGTLCIYRVDRDTAILEKLQYPNMIKDSEGKQLAAQ